MPHLTEAQIRNIPALVAEGHTTQNIARLYHVHYNAIYYWIRRLRKAGYKIPKSKGGRPRIELKMTPDGTKLESRLKIND